MADTYNGIGTTFLGKCKFEQDDSYVTTKWFVVLFPVIPLGSLRVRDLGTEGIPFFKRKTEYEVIERLPLDWGQVLRVYCYTIFITAWMVIWFNSNIPGVARFIVVTLGILLPFGLRFLGRVLSQR